MAGTETEAKEAPSTTSGTSFWWGPYELEVGQCLRCRVHPLVLEVTRRKREWQLAHDWLQGEWDDLCEVETVAEPDPDLPNPRRFVFRQTEAALALRPALADRPVVTSPRVATHVLPGEEAVLYIGSALWLRVETGEPSRRLLEVPVRRPADTWFGPSTRSGELCYASRSQAALQLHEAPHLYRRAITPLRVGNRGSDPLALERVKVPVPSLSLYSAGGQTIWTEALAMVREDAEMARVEVRRGSPAELEGGELVTGPRVPIQSGTLMRAFSGLFGG